MKRVTVEQWKKKVDRLFREEGHSYVMARFVEKTDDGRPVYLSDESEEVAAALDEKQTGVYHVLDDDGKVIAECAVGKTGERESVKAFDGQRAQTQFIAVQSEAWERQNNAIQKDNDKLRADRDKLEAKLEEYRAKIDALQDEIREMTIAAEDGEDDPMLEFVKEAFEFIKGRGLTSELMKRINDRGILDELSPDEQAKMVHVLKRLQ